MPSARTPARSVQWLRNNVDVLMFAAALVGIGLLMAWWGTLARRNIHEMHSLAQAQLEARYPGGVANPDDLATLSEETDRRLFMITGESTLAGVLFATFALLLLIIARRRSAAERRMRRLLQFTTHELKTPVAAVRSLLQSLEMRSIPEEQRAQLIARGILECDRLEHLAEAILTYQRVLSSTLVLAPHSSRELLNGVLEHRRRTLHDERLHWSPGAELRVRAEPDSFRVILENLLDNARKYAGGEVWISEQVRANRWELAVRDRGSGFDPQDAEALFDPFARGSRSEASANHGAGLGLFISRRLAREMGGELSAASAGAGAGSTFTLALELADNGPSHA